MFSHDISFIIVLYNQFTDTQNQGVTKKYFTTPTQSRGIPMEKFLIDTEVLKKGLVIFRRADVQHKNWYCRVKVPQEDRYKVISLKTADINDAKEKAFNHDADIRFRVQHNVPIFDKSFEDVAKEYSEFNKSTARAGRITMTRWKIVDSYIRLHLVPDMGNIQIAHVGDDKWRNYPLMRKEQGASDGTVRQEMIIFRAIMTYAASKGYIQERQVPKGRIPADKARREEFTPKEYRQLHTFARQWVKESRSPFNLWYRTMAYNFMLIMTNTGMRTMEARNLKWKDIDNRKDKHGRPFVTMNVRGKSKFRELVAANNVAAYFDIIKAISKATKPDDYVFTSHRGEKSVSLYDQLIASLLKESGLLLGASGSRRSGYCFRHTYATFRLMEGIDVYFLAKQMGTSVKMIEDYYGHITPAKNAERILQGVPG
ncbi:MAG: tyrosine-type recombinase/integrase, partial [Candidatus Micrarchaeaceae archaeon]